MAPRQSACELTGVWAQSRRWLGLLALLALTFGFVFPILWMVTTSFQAGEKMFQLTTEWIPSVLASRELSQRLVARELHAVLHQQRHRLASP